MCFVSYFGLVFVCLIVKTTPLAKDHTALPGHLNRAGCSLGRAPAAPSLPSLAKPAFAKPALAKPALAGSSVGLQFT